MPNNITRKSRVHVLMPDNAQGPCSYLHVLLAMLWLYSFVMVVDVSRGSGGFQPSYGLALYDVGPI